MFALKYRVRRDLNTDVSVFDWHARLRLASHWHLAIAKGPRENCRDVGRAPARKVHSVICHRSGQHYLRLGGLYGPVKDKMYWPELARRSEKCAGPAGQCLCRGLLCKKYMKNVCSKFYPASSYWKRCTGKQIVLNPNNSSLVLSSPLFYSCSLWPTVVKDRIRATYLYFGSSLVFTAASAVAISRSPVMMNLMMRNSLLMVFGTMAAMIGSGMVCRSLPYTEGFGAKQVAWMVHAGIVGSVIAPLTLLGGPLLIRAACYTAGVVGGQWGLMFWPLRISCAPSFVKDDWTIYLQAGTAQIGVYN